LKLCRIALSEKSRNERNAFLGIIKVLSSNGFEEQAKNNTLL